MTFVQTRPFRKAFARLGLREQTAVESAIQQFKVDRLNVSLRDHALKGVMKGLRAFSAAWDLRVIYREEDGFITIILVDVGSHNQVY
jgi:addiction module RelE/StbE family toxin